MLLKLLSNIYGFFVERRNRKFDNHKIEIIEIRKPVISVGNISAGGTGKTPFVQMLAEELLQRGLKPALIGGGYKRKTKGELIVNDGKNVFATAKDAGDEIYLLSKNLNVPIIVHDKKSLAAKTLDEKYNVDVVIIDDGFQHRKLKRDIDILIIDETTLVKQNLIPAGVLREPIENISRANIIAFAGIIDLKQIEKYLHSEQIKITIKSISGNIYNLSSNDQITSESVDGLKSGMIAFSGIANPHRFYNLLTDLNFKIIKHIKFSDHHRYLEKDIYKIIGICKENSIQYIITTEKDTVKLDFAKKIFEENKIECYVLPIKTEIVEGSDIFWNYVINVIKNFN